jgi:hypothetical protein
VSTSEAVSHGVTGLRTKSKCCRAANSIGGGKLLHVGFVGLASACVFGGDNLPCPDPIQPSGHILGSAYTGAGTRGTTVPWARLAHIYS